MGDELSFHPLAELFPLLPEGELQQLADDIKANGQRDDIWLSDDGRIIDGRNRYRACRRAGVEPRTQTYDGPDALAFVLSKNLHRRHLTESQRASAAAKIANLTHGDNQFSLQNKAKEEASIDASSPPAPPVSYAKAAEMLHVSEKSVERAKKLQREGIPELSGMVDAGDVTISAALELCRLAPSEQKKVASGGAAAVKEKVKKLREEAKGSRGSRSAPATKNKSGSEPVKQDDKKTGDEANGGTPAGASDPFDGPAAKSDPDNPPLDPRFMPHAEEATELAGKFRNWVARLRAVRTEVRKAFPDRDAVVARRIDSFGQFDAYLGELIQTLDENVPECVCPPCCGVGTDAGDVTCKFCDGFGAVDRGHHAGLKAYWKKSRARLELLLSSCGGA